MEKALNTINDFSQAVAQRFKGTKDVLFVGQDMAEAVAQEGSLKMKELTYLHC